MPTPKPTVWPAFAALGAVLIAFGMAIGVAIAISLTTGSGEDLTATSFAVAMVLFAFSLGGFAFGFAVLGGAPRRDLAPGRVERWLAVIAGLLANLALMRLFFGVRHPPEDLSSADSLEAWTMGASTGLFTGLLVALTLATVSYEFLLRGFALRRFAMRWNFPVAIAITAVFDALVEFDLQESIPTAALAVVAGLAAWRARSTWAAVIVMVIPQAVDLLALRAGNLFGGRPLPVLGLVVISSVGWLINDLRAAALTASSEPASGQSSSTTRTS